MQYQQLTHLLLVIHDRSHDCDVCIPVWNYHRGCTCSWTMWQNKTLLTFSVHLAM